MARVQVEGGGEYDPEEDEHALPDVICQTRNRG